MERFSSQNILIIEGPVYLTGAYETPLICEQFAPENEAFSKAIDLQRIADSGELNRKVFQAYGNWTAESKFSGAAHILANEVEAGGYRPVLASLADIFEDSNNKLSITPNGHALLEACETVALSTSFITTGAMLFGILWQLRRMQKRIILGGSLISKWSQAKLERTHFDFALSWEAEGRLSVILAEIRSGAPREAILHEIPGAWWREGGRLVKSRASYAAIDFQKHSVLPSRAFVEMRKGIHSYEAVRGCPFRCEFCDYPFLMGGKKPRFKSAEWIFEEWKALHELGVTRIQALDSLFTVPYKRMAELTKLLIQSKLAKSLSWSCFARSTELSNRAFVENMKEAGCDTIHIGVESGSQIILDNMKKMTTVESNVRAMENCNAVGIPTACTLVVGFPGETEETFQETLAMLDQHSSSVVAPLVWYPAEVESSKVPIMQPERVSQFDIKVEWGNYSIPTRVWGKDVALPFPVRWSHSTMDTETAVRLATKVADRTREDRITGHDAMNSPYISLITHGMKIYQILGYERASSFLRGFRKRYVEFLNGEDPTVIRAGIPDWLRASGLTVAE